MKYLVLLTIMIMFTSCGKQKIEVSDSEHIASGEIDINWNLDEFERIFISVCSEQHDNQLDIDDCVNGSLEDLIDVISKGLQ